MEPDLYREIADSEEVFWWFKARRRILLNLLERYAPAGPSILDMGCGTGFTVQWLSLFYPDVRGMESSPDALKIAESKKLPVEKGSLPSDVPFKEESFDAVLLMDVLEHIDDDGAAVVKAASLLKKDGIIIASVPAHSFMWTRRDDYHHHRRRYSKTSFRKIFGLPELDHILISYFNSILFWPMLASRLLSKILKTDKEGPDIKIPPALINRILEEIFAIDGLLLGRIPIITGASLIAVCRKK